MNLENIKSAPLKESEISPEGIEIIFNEQQIERLKLRTKELIDCIVENNYQTLAFMDKSARPISWMMRAAWNKYAGDRPLPVIRFINIGREKGDLNNWYGRHRNIEDYDDEEEKKILENEEKVFWSNPDNKDFLEIFKKSIKGNSVLLVDDFMGSGFSIGVARDYLRLNFPKNQVDTYVFLDKYKGDEKIFEKEGWIGAHLPWNTDKSYTLLKEGDDDSKITATVEMDPEKRKKGIDLKKQIEKMFE